MAAFRSSVISGGPGGGFVEQPNKLQQATARSAKRIRFIDALFSLQPSYHSPFTGWPSFDMLSRRKTSRSTLYWITRTEPSARQALMPLVWADPKKVYHFVPEGGSFGPGARLSGIGGSPRETALVP